MSEPITKDGRRKAQQFAAYDSGAVDKWFQGYEALCQQLEAERDAAEEALVELRSKLAAAEVQLGIAHATILYIAQFVALAAPEVKP